MSENDLDALLRLLATEQRRRVIRQLRRESGEYVTIEALAEELSAAESGPDGDRQDRRRFEVQLVHTHLPKLADHGVVELGPENDAVRYRPDPQVERMLDSLSGEVTPANPEL